MHSKENNLFDLLISTQIKLFYDLPNEKRTAKANVVYPCQNIQERRSVT